MPDITNNTNNPPVELFPVAEIELEAGFYNLPGYFVRPCAESAYDSIKDIKALFATCVTVTTHLRYNSPIARKRLKVWSMVITEGDENTWAEMADDCQDNELSAAGSLGINDQLAIPEVEDLLRNYFRERRNDES